MDFLLTLQDLHSLFEERGGPCVSIYMPTHYGQGLPTDTEQTRIRLKNLLRDAERQLQARGLRTPEVRSLMEPVARLEADTLLWTRQFPGLAVFRSPQTFRFFPLPLTFEDTALVADAFYVKPLLSLFTLDTRFFLLAISQKQVKLYQGTREGLVEVHVAGMPQSLQELLQYEDPERLLEFHTRTGAPGGRRQALFYGQGGPDELVHLKEVLRQFLSRVDVVLRKLLEQEKAPLVLAGVEYAVGFYRQVNSYPHLLQEWVRGSPERMDLRDLHRRALEVVEPHIRSQMEAVKDRYASLAGTGHASRTLEEIVPSAFYGMVDTLLVERNARQWGRFNPETGEVQLLEQEEADAEELINLAVIHTLLNRGSVFVLDRADMPDPMPALAIFRYPLAEPRR